MSFNVSHVFYLLVPVLDRSDAERFLVYNFAKFCSRTSTRGQKSGSDCSYPSQFVAHEHFSALEILHNVFVPEPECLSTGLAGLTNQTSFDAQLGNYRDLLMIRLFFFITSTYWTQD